MKNLQSRNNSLRTRCQTERAGIYTECTQSALDEKTAQLKDQQAQIDQIIGVKADVIEALKKNFPKIILM